MACACDFEWQHPSLYRPTTGINLCSKLRYHDREINYRILINYARDDIAEEFFRNNVKMEKN